MRSDTVARASRTAVAAALVVAVLALGAAAGCSPNTSPIPPAEGGAPPARVQELPAATATAPPAGAHQGTPSADTYRAVVAALKADGYTMADEGGLRMTYGADRQHVTVNGQMMRQAAGGAPAQVSIVEVTLGNGTWTVISAR